MSSEQHALKLNSIRRVPLGGFAQRVQLVSRDVNNPILLFLHGGPGLPNRHIVRRFRDLLDSFTLVCWDQRGTGGSYIGVDPDSITLDRLVSDAAELCAYLCRELSESGVYLVGQGAGALLATLLAARDDCHVRGVVACGLPVQPAAGERSSYDALLALAEEKHDEAALQTLRRVGPPIGGVYRSLYRGLRSERRVLSHLGRFSRGTDVLSRVTRSVLLSPVYSLGDKYGYIRGHRLVLARVWASYCSVDLMRFAAAVRVPFTLLHGLHDGVSPTAPVSAFYDALGSADKDLIWFSDSAHALMLDEPSKLKRCLRERCGEQAR